MLKQNKQQMLLIEDDPTFPSTRFQGSKLKIVDWIWDAIKDLNFNSALDAFGGTGSVGYMLKEKGKKVTYNDMLKFNRHIGLALIENDIVKLTDSDVDFLLKVNDEIEYPTFVYDTFKDIYFTDEENQWIDMVVTNIGLLDNLYKKALAYFSLFQASIIKRPFNLFHRKNLYLRFSDVERNFGNKATWDTPFEVHFRKFADEANQAVFSNGQQNRALNLDVFDIEGEFDLVYIDTPYISKTGVGVDYFSFYHFLEGLINYPKWAEMIDYRTRHRKLKGNGSVWINKNQIHSAFDRLFKKFQNSILVISYRADGIPSIEELLILLEKYKQNVKEQKRKNYKYVLSTNHSEEVLLIGK
ncbi:MAG: DNA methyltransferase [Deltaproteobacteria bacterium]|jgi:adenine-specific DNA methylase|nr:MAG: DNA methyltransferase [Deltaproteobacteria bacterium]